MTALTDALREIALVFDKDPERQWYGAEVRDMLLCFESKNAHVERVAEAIKGAESR